MPELRRDPVVGYWTIISSERSRRPTDFNPKPRIPETECAFCEGHESQTTAEETAVRKPGTAADRPGWDVRVIPSKAPMLSPDVDAERHGLGMYDLMNGVGKHEIIIESPRHGEDLDAMSVSQVEKVIGVYVDRMNELEKDERITYGLLFKNHGLITGTPHDIIRHSRSQLIGMPITPKRVKEELLATKNYFERRDRCVICDILRQEAADRSRVVAENDSFFAFCPFASRSPFEMWILPKKHSADFGRLERRDYPAFASLLKDCLAKLRTLLSDPPYNFILHTAPFRHKKKKVHWKTIEEDYHWFLLISPRLAQSAGFEWGTGIHINPTPPEDAAELLRGTQTSGDGN